MEQQNITIKYHSGIFTLQAEKNLPITIEQAWDFFSKPENLAKITPDKMGFDITSEKPDRMYAGQIISYKISIFPFFKSNWVTEITQVKEKAFFIDKQLFGPYSLWHHEHHFSKIPGGVRMKDKVSYKIPLGFAGRLVHRLFIRKKLMEIFTHRNEVVEKELVK